MKAAELDVVTRVPMHLNQVAITRAIEADGLFVIGVAHDVDEVSCSIFGIVNGSQPLLWAVEAHISGKLIRDLLIIFDRRDRRSMIFRSEEHTSELQSLIRTSYAVFCLTKKKKKKYNTKIANKQHHI